ncbi:MAG: c-type cytochrome, partial [Hyphomicrobiaceae bacterium]
MRPKSSAVASLLFALWSESGAAAEDIERLKRLGQHLSRECTACHRLDGSEKGIPPIVGLDAEYFVKTL